MVFTESQLHILASSKKGGCRARVAEWGAGCGRQPSPDAAALLSWSSVALLEPLIEPAKAAAGIDLVLHARAKGDAGAGADAPLLAALAASGSPPAVGVFPKDAPTGAVGDAWTAAFAAAGLATVDASPGVAATLAVKDAAELAHAAAAGALAAGVLTAYVVQEVERVIDEDRPVKHAKLALRAERVAADPASKGLPAPADPCDAAYPPTICSGGVHDLKLAAPPDDRPLSADAVTVGLGARVACYCANVGRTYLVDPDEGQEAMYGAALAAHSAAVAALVAGAPLAAPHAAATASLQACGVPDLAPALGKSVGAGIGLELRESALSLTAGAVGAVAAGMVFNVTLAFNNLPGKAGGKPWAILLADTVAVAEGGAPPRVLTDAASKAWGDIAYELDDEEEEEEGKEAGSGADEEEAAARAKTRGAVRADADAGAAPGADRDRARAGQDALVERINEETLAALKGAGGGGARGARGARLASDVAAYRAPADVPAPPTARVAVDGRAEAVLVPLYGGTLPIHVLAVKNATLTPDAGGAAIVRLALGAGAGYEPCARFPDAVAIKELAFRVSDGKTAARVVAEIKALRASVAARDREKAERATLVAQEKLVKAAGRAPTLPDVWVRPPLGGKGRRVTGTLEAHVNGFRYASPKGDTLDVMYRNIKFAFFQPAEGEAITLVGEREEEAERAATRAPRADPTSFLLLGPLPPAQPDHGGQEKGDRHPVLHRGHGRGADARRRPPLGVRPGRDRGGAARARAARAHQPRVPILCAARAGRRVGEGGARGAGARVRGPIPRARVHWRAAPDRLVCAAHRQLPRGAHRHAVHRHRAGRHHRRQPGARRVWVRGGGGATRRGRGARAATPRHARAHHPHPLPSTSLRNFDMTLVKRDLSDAVRIDAIPMKALDTIREWLHSIDVKFYESKINLQWPAVLKSIREDPDAFVEAGGWDFLEFDGGGASDDDSEDGDAEFAPSGSDSDGSDDDDDSGSDASVESEESDGDGDAELSEGEQGMDWEELEQEAARADRKHAGGESDDGGGGGNKGKKARR